MMDELFNIVKQNLAKGELSVAQIEEIKEILAKRLAIIVASYNATYWCDDDNPKAEYRASRELTYVGAR